MEQNQIESTMNIFVGGLGQGKTTAAVSRAMDRVKRPGKKMIAIITGDLSHDSIVKTILRVTGFSNREDLRKYSEETDTHIRVIGIDTSFPGAVSRKIVDLDNEVEAAGDFIRTDLVLDNIPMERLDSVMLRERQRRINGSLIVTMAPQVWNHPMAKILRKESFITKMVLSHDGSVYGAVCDNPKVDASRGDLVDELDAFHRPENMFWITDHSGASASSLVPSELIKILEPRFRTAIGELKLYRNI